MPKLDLINMQSTGDILVLIFMVVEVDYNLVVGEVFKGTCLLATSGRVGEIVAHGRCTVSGK